LGCSCATRRRSVGPRPSNARIAPKRLVRTMSGHGLRYDQLTTGRKIRLLTVVDTFSRYVPVRDPTVQLSQRRCDGLFVTAAFADRVPLQSIVTIFAPRRPQPQWHR
jgi:transposase InsO family protein